MNQNNVETEKEDNKQDIMFDLLKILNNTKNIYEKIEKKTKEKS